MNRLYDAYARVNFAPSGFWGGGGVPGPHESSESNAGSGSADGTTTEANISVTTDNGTYYGTLDPGDNSPNVTVELDGPYPSK